MPQEKKQASKNQTTRRILESTKKHIVRNKWLSMASTIVIFLTFIIATTIIGMVIISSKTISTFEKKAQIMVFFKNDTAEEDILETQKVIEDTNLTESVEYISKEEALEIYKEDFEDEPELVESITSDALPPSLGIRAENIEDIPKLIKICDKLKDDNSDIEEIMYFKDVVDTLRGVSRVINIGGIILVIALSAISVVLILITIGFNINAHKNEIEVMHLIGSTDSYIRLPFLLEGAFYGFIGSALSIIILLIIWYGSIYLLKGNDLFFFVAQTLREINMPYLKDVDPLFVVIIFFTETIIGSLIGFASSSIAIWKYLR